MPIRAYLSFAAENRRFVAFGFLMAFCSSFGQTYFIGIFGPSIQAEFGLSHTAWGSTYMVGTLASAALLPWTGKLIDRAALERYATGVYLAIVAACLGAAAVAGSLTLVIAIFALRHTGQGLMSHVAVTSMARYFASGRGRAIAIAALGFSAGEAVLPFFAVLAIAAVGWRSAYAGSAVLLLFLLPLVFWCLAGHGERHRRHLEQLAGRESDADPAARAWTRAEMLRDARFYLLVPAVTAPSMILTGMFFHHLNLADAKHWSHAWITGSYFVYALAAVAMSLTAGRLIDRFGALPLVPWMLAPLGAALVIVTAVDDAWVAWPYFVLAGLSTGIAHTALSAMWAELYGVTHLGAIRSLAAAMSVFASALGPVAMGALMDSGVTIERVYLLFAAYCVLASVLIVPAFARRASPMPSGGG
ncbi:MAG: MFS transporter [Gammaproteobacteria bacterium]|nr:MFS transporter [Gammaproteobacteria bacterium]